MKQIAIVIPTYNEKANIANLLRNIETVSEKILDHYALSVIFVDDNSPDGTAEEIERQRPDLPFEVYLIKRKGKLGLGTAYIAGFKKAIKLEMDNIFQMDADLSHDPEVIPEMCQALETHDFVIGARYIKGGKLPKWSLVRKLVSHGGNLYTRILLGLGIHDWTGGFNGYRRETLEGINLDAVKSNGYSFQIEMKYKAKKNGAKFMEVPIEFHERNAGKSKFSKKIFVEAFLNAVKLRLGML